MLLQRLNVFNIFLILIYFFYRKKTSSTTNGLFASRTKEDVTNLRGALSNIKKLNMTADEYVAKMRGFASSFLPTLLPHPQRS
jgi:hypothetical protein